VWDDDEDDASDAEDEGAERGGEVALDASDDRCGIFNLLAQPPLIGLRVEGGCLRVRGEGDVAAPRGKRVA
jgi:hypothetical protein